MYVLRSVNNFRCVNLVSFTLTMLVCCCSWSHAQDENVFYYKNGKKVPLTIKASKSYVLLANETMEDNFMQEAKTAKLALRKFAEVPKLTSINLTESAEENSFKWAIVEAEGEDGLALGELQSNREEVIYQAPFFTLENGEEIGLSHLLYVKLNRAGDVNALEKLAKEIGVDILGNNQLMPLWYTLACKKDSKGNALQVANLIFESGKVEVAEPDFLSDFQIKCVNDQHFPSQWGLKNTGQGNGTAGIDMSVCDAWQITKGSPSIRVAVLDHGIQFDHPDVTNVANQSFDTYSGTSPSVIHGSHGMACAGIVGADANNSGLGVAGIAPGITLISISDKLTLGPNAQQNLASGISWAWQNGADVISNSWGHNNLASAIIDDAIQMALTQGRAGKGCVMCFAAGNSNGPVIYPGNSEPDLLVVGAMSPCGERKNPASCDGESWWGSCYGSEIDVVAPGVLIPTTDLTGTAGYDTGNYTMDFNGTSSATPHVAALAALLLSVDASLSQKQVVDIIESSARKVGPYTYSQVSARPNGGWNEETGYGLIDASSCLNSLNLGSGKPTKAGQTLTKGSVIEFNDSNRSQLSMGNQLQARSDSEREEAMEGKEIFYQIVEKNGAFEVRPRSTPVIVSEGQPTASNSVALAPLTIVLNSEVTTAGTGHFPNWDRSSKTSEWSTITTPANYVFVKDSMEKRFLSRNGSSNRIDHEWDDYVEVIPGTGIKMPRTLRIRTHARSPERCGGCRGWTKGKVTATYVKYSD